MEIGPVFHAENSNTVRHLTEFTGLDMEMEIPEYYHEVVDILEKLMLFIFNGLNGRYAKETELIRNVYAVESSKPPEISNIPRIEFSEGVKMLREASETLRDYDGLTTPQEKKSGQLILEKYGSTFTFSTSFPLLCVLSILCLPRRSRTTQTLTTCLCVDKRFSLVRNIFISTISSSRGSGRME